MRSLAVNEKLASGQKTFADALRLLDVPALVADPHQETLVANDDFTSGVSVDPDGDGVNTTINLRIGNSYFDQESGWWLMGQRYYDPTTGRFPTSDPIGLDGGLNTYAYVGNNPLRYIDPTGLQAGTASAADGLSSIARPMPPNPAGEAIRDALQRAVPEIAGRICVGAALFLYTTPYDPNVARCDENPTSCPIYSRPPGFWPGDKGAEEWGRRNGVGADEGRRRFHGVKQGAGGRGKDDYSTNPEAGDVVDQNGDDVGNLNDAKAK